MQYLFEQRKVRLQYLRVRSILHFCLYILRKKNNADPGQLKENEWKEFNYRTIFSYSPIVSFTVSLSAFSSLSATSEPLDGCQSVSLEYTILSFRPLTSEDENRLRKEAGWSPAPRGVFCPRPDIYRRKLPEIQDQFSVVIETIDGVRGILLFSFYNLYLFISSSIYLIFLTQLHLTTSYC